MPPFTVRRAKKIITTLERFAITRGYVGVPIHAVLDKEVWTNPMEYNSCETAYKENLERIHNETSYAPHEWLIPALRPTFVKAFNLTEEQSKNITFYDADGLADSIICHKFEGIPLPINISEDSETW